MPTGAAVGAALVLAAISEGNDAGRRQVGAGRSAPDPPGVAWPAMDLAAFQQLMADTYGERDRARGVPATVAWLTEELGELAQAVRKGDRVAQVHELGDVLAWLASLAGQLGIGLDEAAARYADGCPRCGGAPCRCP
jgi:NTP pyrophosphatase (non-canonical NTP hydrolase)